MKIKVGKKTASQKEFWQSRAKFRLYRGGVGSGKTFASAIEAMRQPKGSTGMVVAPTYPMLRDATLVTFLRLARKAQVLRSWRKGDMEAVLAGGRTVLFRSASDPDRLRGPNLGWFAIDEGALVDPEVWQIMLGRIRKPPYRGWISTTPRGRLNWTHTTFSESGQEYATFVASTRDAFWLPPEFVASMQANYSHDFARQEIDGEVLDDAQEGLIPVSWLDVIEQAVRDLRRDTGPRRMGVDLGYGTGRDSFTAVVRDDLGIVAVVESPFVGVPQAAAIVARESKRLRVRQEHVTYDAGGPGRDMPRYLEAVGITEARPYFGSGRGGKLAENLRSLCAWRLRQRLDIQRPGRMPPGDDSDPNRYHPLFVPYETVPPDPVPFSLPADRPWWPRMRRELENLRYSMKARKVVLERKEDLAARLKHSPDMADALIMTFYDGTEAA